MFRDRADRRPTSPSLRKTGTRRHRQCGKATLIREVQQMKIARRQGVCYFLAPRARV